MEREYIASLFMNGGSQAVRLPKDCRFEGDAVRVRKQGNAVILEPLEKRQWSPGFWERLHTLAAQADIEAPERRLGSSDHRYAIFDDESDEQRAGAVPASRTEAPST